MLAATNTIATVAGTGTAGYNGDGIAASAAQLATPTYVATTADGGYLISDQGNSRVRRVSPSGTIATVAGNGTAGAAGDGGPATSAQLSAPNGLAELADGSILIADSNNNRVRRVAPDGLISTFAGTGAAGYNGDNIAATTAQLNFPIGLAVLADGSVLIGDNDNNRVRRVAPGGTITTVVGTGTPGSAGDGGPAAAASLNGPAGVAATADGGYLVVELDGARVRQVSPGGTIVTAAGGGAGGDGGPAAQAQLLGPTAVAAMPGGGFSIAESAANRVRLVSAAGVITTLAGTGTAGAAGDGGLATAAQLAGPFGVALTSEGDVLIADSRNQRVRRVDAGDAAAPPAPTPPTPTPPDATAALQPTVHRTVVATASSGTVTVKLPGTSRFVTLTAARVLPLGTVFDVRRGRVTLTSAADARGRTQQATFYGGVFKVSQTSGSRPVTTLTLVGPLPRCEASGRGGRGRAGRGGRRASAAKKAANPRRLWGDGQGSFSTRGKYSSATVRGTKWYVEDQCPGTLTRVARGTVGVRDFVLRRTVVVRAGKQYLARRPG